MPSFGIAKEFIVIQRNKLKTEPEFQILDDMPAASRATV